MRYVGMILFKGFFSVLQDWEEGDGKYVAPELLDADVEPTPAADVYSLGATLYECATGTKYCVWLRIIHRCVIVKHCCAIVKSAAKIDHIKCSGQSILKRQGWICTYLA